LGQQSLSNVGTVHKRCWWTW